MDLIIKNGTIIDENCDLRVADIGIADQEIEFIGKEKLPSDKTIDATGLFVIPGFIDVHSHNDNIITGKTPFSC